MWKPKQSAIKDKNGKMLQDKAEVKKRWTEYCSGLYTDRGNSDTVITELDQISPPPNEDEMHYILYKEVAEAVKRLKKGKSPGINQRNNRRNDTSWRRKSYRRDAHNL